MGTPEIVKNFISMYETLDKDNLHLLRPVYSDDIVFIDALHEVKGLEALETYFAGMYGNLISSSIKVTDVQCSQTEVKDGSGEGVAYMTWSMTYVHPQLANKKAISLDGVTKIKYTDKVTYHRDYADMGQMLYEHIPVLGSAIRYIKRRAVS